MADTLPYYIANPSMPIPGAPPVLPPIGMSTQETPSTALLPSIAAPSTPDATHAIQPFTQTQNDIAERNRMLANGPGINQVKNPIAHGFLKALDITNSVFGAINPLTHALASAAPGTTLHHNVLVNRQNAQIGQDEAQDTAALNQQDLAAQVDQRKALATQEQAKAEALSNPKLSDGEIVYDGNKQAIGFRDGDGNYHGVNDPNLPQGLKDVLSAAKPKSKLSVHDTEAGPILVNDETGDAQHVTLDGQPVGPKTKLEYQTVLGPDGKPHTYGVDPDGNRKVDLGVHYEKPITVNNNAGTLQLDSVPDGKGGTKTVLFNNKTGALSDAPTGLTRGPGVAAGSAPMTVADKNRASLARIANNNLDQVQDIVTRRPDLLGKMGAVKTVADLVGSNDPDLVALGNEVHNFAMANAGIHGSRSFENVRAAEQELLGHFKNGSKGIQGGIDANRKNLQEVMNPSGNNSNGVIVVKPEDMH